MFTSRIDIGLKLLLLITGLVTPGVAAAGIPCLDKTPSGVFAWTLVYDLADGQGKLFSFKDEALREKLNEQLGNVASCADGESSNCLGNVDQQLRNREKTLNAIRSQGTVQKRIISSKGDVFAIYVFYRPIEGQPDIARPSEEPRRSRLQTDLQTLGQIGLALATAAGGPEAFADPDDRFPIERGLALCVASYELTEKRAELTLKARVAQDPALGQEFLKDVIKIKEQRSEQLNSNRIVVERLRLEIKSAAIDLEEAMNVHEQLDANKTLLELNETLRKELPEALIEIENRLARVIAALETLANAISKATGTRLEELEADRARFLAEKSVLERDRKLAKQDTEGIQERIGALREEVGHLALGAASEDAAKIIRASLTKRLEELSEKEPGDKELHQPEVRREVLELLQLADEFSGNTGEVTGSVAKQESEFVEEILRTGPTERLHLSTDIPVNDVDQLQIDEDNQQLMLADEPSRFYLGLNYQFGDTEIQYKGRRFWKNFYLKGMIEASSEPLDSWGVAVGIRGIPFKKKFLDLSTLAPFIGYTFTKQAESMEDGTLVSNSDRNSEFRIGISLNLTQALTWIRGEN